MIPDDIFCYLRVFDLNNKVIGKEPRLMSNNRGLSPIIKNCRFIFDTRQFTAALILYIAPSSVLPGNFLHVI